MFNHIHTLFFEIVLAPKVSPTIEMMNKWGSDDLKSAAIVAISKLTLFTDS